MLKKLVNALPGGVGIFKCTPHLHCLYFNKGLMDLGSRLPQQIQQVFDSSVDLEKLISPAYLAHFRREFLNRARIGQPINANFCYYTGESNADQSVA
ncbi:hypothetical protein [Butyricicoccus sp. Marseille-Q5471]|uniref:hypothetical protein n=1 Tax=Butyricicoccus sp. Marseille-Q5471 TaxID=3039493 RepID=UPI0024BC6D4C|nr:hypothetical protein [Butyricicoccus sp. Marseille-Q5471]